MIREVRPAIHATLVASVVALAWARPAAADPAGGAPVDLATLPSLGGRPTGPIQVHAADADAGRLRNLVAGVAKVNLIEPPLAGTRISGRIAGDAAALSRALAAGGFGAPARPLGRKGKGPDVDLDFTGADRDDLLRMLALVSRINLVIAAPGRQTLDVRVRRMPAGGVLDVAAARLGLERTTHGTLTWLRAAGGPTLDRKLLALKGPRKVTLDVVGARAGEVYALLAALGAEVGGAACGAGAPITFQLRDAPVGAAVAVAAALSGQPPGAGAACAGEAPVRDFHDLQLRAIATSGAARAAAFGAGAGSVIATRSLVLGGATIREIGSGFVALDIANPSMFGEQRTLMLHPSTLVDGLVDDVPVGDGLGPTTDPVTAGVSERITRTLRDGRLAATIIAPAGALALFELPGDRWVVIGPHDLRVVPRDAVVIEPGRVRYRLLAADAGIDLTGEALLRARR